MKVTDYIADRINRLPIGYVFTYDDFKLKVVHIDSVIKALGRMVKTGKISKWEGSIVLARPCACGIFNPFRAAELLKEKAPLYTVARW